MTFDVDAFMVKGAGFAGALVSLGHVKGTWLEKLSMFVGGGFSSYYLAPFVVDKLGLPESAAGFLVGLFGMSIVAKTYEYIQTTSLSDLLPFLKPKSSDPTPKE